MITCMTCYETAQRWKTWEQDPVQAMQRELVYAQKKRTESMRCELLAIAELIRAHKEEFERLVLMQEFKVLEGIKS